MKADTETIRILHLEDNQIDAKIVTRTLEKANLAFEVLLIDSREEFTQSLSEFAPHIVLCDHGLPTFNSLEALDIMHQAGMNIPFILVTGLVSEEFLGLALQRGAADFVLKDRIQRLPIAVTHALERHKLALERTWADRQLQNISEYSQDIFCNVDADGRFLFVSAAVKKLWGYDSAELIGHSFIDFVHPDDRAISLDIAQLIKKDKRIDAFENRYVHKNGSVVPMIWSATYEEKEQTLFAVGRDATEQIKARESLDASRKQYQQLISQLPAAVYTCDHTGKIILFNKAAVELWGRVPDLERDRWCGSWKAFKENNEPMPAHTCPMAKSIITGKEISGEGVIIERPDKTRRYVVSYPSLQTDEQGRVTGAINVLIDITERKKSEQETDLLVEQLQSINNDLKQFSYMISHNLRAPIARILGLAHIIHDDPGNEKFIIDKICEETENLDTIIKDINEIITARDTQVDSTTYVDFGREVARIQKVLQPEVDECGAVITTNFLEVEGMKTVKAFLYSILYNLMSNALKYRSSTRTPSIYIESLIDVDRVCLSITDNGVGLNLEKNGDKLFSLYRKFHGLEFPGRGVGLSLVKAQVEALRGKIDVSSKIDEGTTFRIYLPLKYESGN